MTTFQITSDAEGKLILTGELSYLSVTPEIWEQSKALLQAAPASIDIDVGGITRSDSTGVALLISWVRYAKKLSKVARLLHTPEQMRAIIHVSGLENLLPAD